MVQHSPILILGFLFLFPLAAFAQDNQNVYELTFFGRRLCCDNVWPNGNCPDDENDFNVGVTGATAVLKCKKTTLNTTKTDNGWFTFVFTGKENPVYKYDLVKKCRIYVTNASNSDCPNLSVPLVSRITGIPADGIIDYANNGDFAKLTKHN